MFKRNLIFIIALMISSLTLPTASKAAGEFTIYEVYDPNKLITSGPSYNSGSDSIVVYISGTKAKKVYYASYPNSSFSTPTIDKYLFPSQYGWTFFTGMSFNCNTYYEGILYDSNDNVLVRIKIHITGLVNPVCDSSSGGVGEENSDCDSCEIFNCPGWDKYMGKLDDIRNAIPPPPNWPVVANTFRDSIVPKLINDLGDLLGTAPEPPAAPPQLPGLDDRGIKSQEPEMQDVPGLKESGFDASKIKNEAPVIEEREDPTGGFDLTTNPMDTLPDAPENPIPGQTDAGEWGKNKPKEEDNPFPFPKDKGDPNIGTPPKPGDNGAAPPIPEDDPGSAPKPGGDLGNGPTPGGGEGNSGMKDYKSSPDSPDGSGKDIYP